MVPPNPAKLVGSSPVFREMLLQLSRVAITDAPVLIEGETGTGKELVARAVHYGGERAERPFIPVNCGAIPDQLFENELFGHVRGAYTDAREPQPGLVALANGGTLFLDEVDALSQKGQVALLRFLQDMNYRPLGSRREESADVRIIAATNADLARAQSRREFRSDLYYRLQVLIVQVPPLRARTGDACLLAEHYIRVMCHRLKWPSRRLDPASVAGLEGYGWPGNVRELESLVQRAVLLSDAPEVFIDPFALATQRAPERKRDPLIKFHVAKAQAIEHFERDYVTRLLSLTHGNLSEAARLSGKERSRLGKLVRKYGLRREAFDLANMGAAAD